MTSDIAVVAHVCEGYVLLFFWREGHGHGVAAWVSGQCSLVEICWASSERPVDLKGPVLLIALGVVAMDIRAVPISVFLFDSISGM